MVEFMLAKEFNCLKDKLPTGWYVILRNMMDIAHVIWVNLIKHSCLDKESYLIS